MPGLETLALIISSLATTTFAANALYLGTYALALGGLAYASAALRPDQPSVPKPEDGTFNLKQNVPSLTYVLGWTKKGGDYAFLEEKNGRAYHIIVAAAHECSEYIQHYLHDDAVTVDSGGGVLTPNYYFSETSNVRIFERLGTNASAPYGGVISAFPTIWGANHRGDGLATVLMTCGTVSQKNYRTIYPNQMPQWSAVIAGAKLYDPRNGTTGFSRNLARMRLWHLTHPVGGKLSLDDIYLPDFSHAADVCDQTVINRDGGSEARYYGGFWFRANNDPSEVGRIMDQAAELIVYERPDGLVGVHAGEFVEPDITLLENDVIISNLDANTRDSSNVLAVRGRYVRLDLDYNLADAAIYGDPYVDGDDTERTKTIDNNAVQSHNHVQRLQKIAYIRANAPRVSIKAHYEPAENVPYRRFVRVNIPPKFDNVIVEITKTPQLSLRNLTIDFSGIVVPETLYDFDAATEEGEPGNDVILVENGVVPEPIGFDVEIRSRTVSGGTKVAYARATWDHVDDALVYELEWQPIDESEPPRSVNSEAEEDEVQSGFLEDGVEYRFRLRTWGGGVYSVWTDYEVRTATADPVAPGIVTNVSLAGGVGQVNFNWKSPNSANYFASRLYLNTTNTFVGATPVATEYGAAAANDARIVAGLTAGTYYGFIEAINASGVPAAAVATGSAIVS